MKVRNTLYRTVYLAGSVLLLLSAAEAQIVFKRNPTSRVTQPTPPPQEQQAQTRGGNDQITQAQPAPEQPRAQRRRTDDQIFQTPQQEQAVERPRIPDAIIQPQTPNVPDANRPMKGPPYIFASPSQVKVKPGENFGYTALMWDGGPNHRYAEVWRQVDGGAEEFVIEKGAGQTGAKIEIGKTYTFMLSDFGVTLDTVTVTATNLIIGDLPGGLIKRPDRITEGTMATYVTDVRTEPRSNGVEILFWSTPDAGPIVEIGTTAPIQSNGKWVFPAGRSVGNGSAIASQKTGPLSKKVGTKANTHHRFDSDLPGFPALEPGTNYWYIITTNVAGSNQTTGAFTTASQRVRVVFETIKITNSSDDDDFLPDGGEIDLWFWANRGQATEQRFKIQNLNDNRAFTNHFYNLKGEFVIEGAPNILTLDVQGKEGDMFFGQGSDDSQYYPGGRMGPSKSENGEFNYAVDQWDLKRFSTTPGETFRQPFKLVSMPNGGDKGNLSFEVHGYWEVTRRN